MVSDALSGVALEHVHAEAVKQESGVLGKSRTPVPDIVLHSSNDSVGLEDQASVSDDGENDDINFSQIGENDQSFAPNASAISSPAKDTATSQDTPASVLSMPVVARSTDAKTSPTLHPSFHLRGSKLDESSSFEADSPVRPAAGSHPAAQQRLAAAELKDSFAEVSEEELSIEEEVEEISEEGSEALQSEDGDKDGEERTKGSTPASSHEKKNVQVEEEIQAKSTPTFDENHEAETGPEYESGSDYSGDAKSSDRQPRGISALAKEEGKHHSDPDSDRDVSVRRTGAESSSLRPAVAGDFDPTDRNAAANQGLPAPSQSLNQVAVRRAAAETAESKSSSMDSAPGAKANVFRLGQVSRRLMPSSSFCQGLTLDFPFYLT